ncbi:hypothetical protein EC973_007881, partial [Apophysomyces ossiformis]
RNQELISTVASTPSVASSVSNESVTDIGPITSVSSSSQFTSPEVIEESSTSIRITDLAKSHNVANLLRNNQLHLTNEQA